MGKEAHATIAGGQAVIIDGGHPARGGAAGGRPDVGAQGRADYLEVDAVRCVSGGVEGLGDKGGGDAVNLFLNDQVAAVDVGLVPVVAIRPA